jgi:steroid delta-isomerase-like uncharacterized protein
MSVENINAARRLFEEAWSQGKIELFDELCSERFVDHDPLLGEADLGALKDRVSTYRAAFPDLTFTIDEIFAAGDRVITRWSAVGTFENELMGFAPTGEKRDPIEGIGISRFEDGKVVETWTQWDTLRFMKDLGAIPQDAAVTAGN